MKRSTLFAIIVVTLLLGAGLTTFFLLENHELDKWTDPADVGEFVVAIRVDRGDWHTIDDAGRHMASLLPDVRPDDGQSGHFQKWRGSGWRRTSRQVTDGISLQELADKSRQFTSENCRICIVDSNGKVYKPNE